MHTLSVAKRMTSMGIAVLTAMALAAGCSAGPDRSPGSGSSTSTTTAGRSGPRPARLFRPTDSGVYGDLYLPDRPGRYRAVLVLGGSEGGTRGSDVDAATLATQGFAALAVAYFNEPGLPDHLENVPIEYFTTAARLLAGQPEVDPTHVAVMGTSRGSEAAALLAGLAPELVHGAVLQSPSSVVYPGYPDPSEPAWTWHGVALPASPAGDPVAIGVPKALLPVAAIHGPIITVCGTADQVWDSCGYAAEIIRLAGPGRVTALRYSGAGHAPMAIAALTARGIPVPTAGGTLADNVTAGRDALARIATVLNTSP